VSGGIVMGIPIVIPHSSTTFGCGECGCEFQSETWNQHRSLSPAESVGLDLEQILSLTNPVLYERVMLERLRADARLEEVFVLLGKLRPSSLHSDLKRSLMNWSQLDEEQCIHFLTSTRRCTEAICFTEVMANRSKSGAVGCLGGILGSAGVWIGCIALFGTNVSLMGSLGILFAGLLTGTSVSGLLWSARDRSWLQAVLLPEADREKICLGWLLQVLERSRLSEEAESKLASFREIAPAIRSHMAAEGKAIKEPEFHIRTRPASSNKA
jgi:hypothetical protein